MTNREGDSYQALASHQAMASHQKMASRWSEDSYCATAFLTQGLWTSGATSNLNLGMLWEGITIGDSL